jgi:hypothetical protein
VPPVALPARLRWSRWHTRERWLSGALALQLTVSTLAVLAMSGDPEVPARTSAPETAVRNARVDVSARAVAVHDLLAARAEAVRRHDRVAFLATVDPRATAFRASQASYVDALEQVPIGRWDYQLDASHEQPHTPALDRLRGQWWAPDVTLRYALAGFDDRPTLQQQTLTFVLRQGRWYVASDSDFGTTRRTGRGLWDGGPVQVRTGRSCLVLSHPGHDRLTDQVATECEAAVPRVTAVWGRGWAQKVVVLVPSSVPELSSLLPGAGDLSQIAALATAELLSPGKGYHPVGDRVLINPKTFVQLGRLGRRVVITHEVTHVASRPATGPSLPTWLVEGLADYVGYRDTGVPVAVAAEELRSDVRAGLLPTALPADGRFDGARSDLPQAYEMSWLAVRLLARQYGEKKLLLLYRTAGGDPRPDAFARALTRTTGLSTRAFVSAWRAELRRTLG